MTWLNDKIFTDKCLERAERKKGSINIIDRFIWLWIAFNSWMKGKFGERMLEKDMIHRVKGLKDMEEVFLALKRDDRCFNEDLLKLGQYTVANMRYINDESRNKRYDGTFESLIGTIYQVRCNLFHGRKDIGNKEERKLVNLAYRILLPLFKKYLSTYEYR